MSARRLALIVFAAAGIDFVAFYATNFILVDRGPIALGYTGMLTPWLLLLLCPILVLDAGLLALRRRAATIPEVAVLGAVAGILIVLGGISWAEGVFGYLPDGFIVVAICWLASALAAIASVVVIIVATIRAPRAPTHTTEPATVEEDRTHA